MASTAEGSRNHRLNVAAFRLGQIVGGGHLEPGRLEAALMVAAAACGLPADEAARTIASGLAAGLDEPRGPTTDNRRVQRGPRPNDASPGPDDPGPERGDPRPVTRANGADQHACDDAEPVDLWAFFAPPALPRGSLPPVIEDFAFVKGEIIGADPAGLAVAALAVCAGALTDAIKLQVKRHDPNWLESARLWVALIGEPSTKKSPALDAAIRPLAVINAGLRDATIEAAQVALRDNPQGLLCHQDELAGWFGGMDKYAGPRGAAKDRGFWPTAYNGGAYAVDRISRGSCLIENLSVCVLGGIQPGPVRALASDGHDDGLFARICPLVISTAGVGRDEPMPDAEKAYRSLVEALHRRQPEPASRFNGYRAPVLRFDDGAQAIRQNLEAKHLELQKSFETINRKLAAHIGKYDGLFARLCVIWHAVESAGWEVLPCTITVDVAARVERFMHGFLLPHAIAFYAGMLGLSDDHDTLAAVAGYILARRLEVVTNRDVQRGNRTMRGLERRDVQRIFQQLEALGWLHEVPARRVTDPPHWAVNPKCHQLFRDRGHFEAETRARARAQIAESLGGARSG